MKWLKSLFINLDQKIRQNEVLLGVIRFRFLALGIITQIGSFATILQFRVEQPSIVGSIVNE